MILFLIIFMYLVGYLTGYKECENMAQKTLNDLLEEQKNKDEYKINKYEGK